MINFLFMELNVNHVIKNNLSLIFLSKLLVCLLHPLTRMRIRDGSSVPLRPAHAFHSAYPRRLAGSGDPLEPRTPRHQPQHRHTHAARHGARHSTRVRLLHTTHVPADKLLQ